MIEQDIMKRGIIEFIQADPNLMAVFSGTKQVKEATYQGQDFTYPHIRVTMLPQIPIGNGTDRLKLSQINWVIEVESESTNSQEADHILGLVVKAQFNKQWTGTDNNKQPYFKLIRVDLIHSQDAYRTPMKIWVASATFQSEANKLVDP